ncbi:MAG: hypothetical protein ACLRZ7_10550, partial [Lachnospiraceae bacterium]
EASSSEEVTTEEASSSEEATTEEASTVESGTDNTNAPSTGEKLPIGLLFSIMLSAFFGIVAFPRRKLK